nr:unnamed protein product [Callosobruchus analis]
MLTEWKTSVQDSRETVVQKCSFPMLLNRLVEILEPTPEANIRSGFRKCGIFPLDSLEAKSLEWTNRNTRRRKRKLDITPGKSVTEELSKLLGDKENVGPTEPSTSKIRCRQRLRASSESSYTESWEASIHNSSDEASIGDLENPDADNNLATEGCVQISNFKPLAKAVGQYVVFTYEGDLFAVQITKISEQGPCVSSMTKSRKSWRWQEPLDGLDFFLFQSQLMSKTEKEITCCA